MAAFTTPYGAQAWRNGILQEIKAQNPNWDSMDREQRKAAAKAWRESLSPEAQSVLMADYQNYKKAKAAQQPAQPQQPTAPAVPQQPQAGIRPGYTGPMNVTREDAENLYGAKGYKGEYVQNNVGAWVPADAEWRHTHTPYGDRRPGIRPGVYGSSPAEIRGASIARHEAQTNAAQATEDRWQAAENAAAARQRAPGKPYVAGGSFSADGRTNGEVYDMWRKRGSVSGIRRTL